MKEKIGIIGGTGPQGQGLALRFGCIGENINLGSRNEKKGIEIATKINNMMDNEKIVGMTNSEVIMESDILLLTIPIARDPNKAETRLVDFLASFNDFYKPGTIIVDVTVPLVFEKDFVGLLKLSKPSISEIIKNVVPNNVHVVSAFKSLSAEKLINLENFPTLEFDVFVCGDNEPKDKIMNLASRVPNLRPIDTGNIKYARYCEMLTALSIGINKTYQIKDTGLCVCT